MIISKKKYEINNKFSNDLIWNIASFGIVAACGLAINSFISIVYDFETLGYFNIVYAIYILLSQVSAWGVHLSIQKYIPQFADSLRHYREIFTTGLILSVIFSIIVTSIALIGNKLPGIIMNDAKVEIGFIYAVPGLIFFTINKSILSFLNGMRYMKSYAVFNALRPFLMLVFIVFIYIFGYNIKYLALVFTIPEFILSIILFAYTFNQFIQINYLRLIKISKLLFRHANRAALGHIVLDLNSKIDILVLGIFVNSSLVGIYSFAVFVSDGFIQIFYVFRTNINPVITKAYFKHSKQLFERVINRNIRKFYKIFTAFGLLILIGYPLFLWIFNINEMIYENISVFAILLLGVILTSGYIPFQMIFNQIGKPKEQTKFLIYTFLVNLIFNFVLIPIIGIYGAAIAVLLSLVFQACYIQISINNKSFIKR